MTEEQVRHARDLLACPENTVTSIAKLLGVSRNTIYNYVPELKGGRLALAEATNTPEFARRERPGSGGGRRRSAQGGGLPGRGRHVPRLLDPAGVSAPLGVVSLGRSARQRCFSAVVIGPVRW
jgi:hypothetical protein